MIHYKYKIYTPFGLKALWLKLLIKKCYNILNVSAIVFDVAALADYYNTLMQVLM